MSFGINKTKDLSESLWRLLCLLSFKTSSQYVQFQNLESIPRYSLVLAGEYSVTWRASERKFLMDYN